MRARKRGDPAGAERRRCRRIPLRCEMDLEIGSDQRKVQLVEISGETCRFVTDRDIPGGASVKIKVNPSLPHPSGTIRIKKVF